MQWRREWGKRTEGKVDGDEERYNFLGLPRPIHFEQWGKTLDVTEMERLCGRRKKVEMTDSREKVSSFFSLMRSNGCWSHTCPRSWCILIVCMFHFVVTPSLSTSLIFLMMGNLNEKRKNEKAKNKKSCFRESWRKHLSSDRHNLVQLELMWKFFLSMKWMKWTTQRYRYT